MKKIFYIGVALIVSGWFLLQSRPTGSEWAEPTVAAAQSVNVLVRVPSPREPVEITKLQVRGNDVTPGVPFAGDESWVNALSAEVKNTSGKAITELRMSLSFEAGGSNPHKINIPLDYLGQIQPQQTARASAPTASIAPLKDLLAKQGTAANFRRGELRLQLAKFQDGSVWVKGVTLGPLDPRTGKRKHT